MALLLVNATVLRVAAPQLIVLACQLAGRNGFYFLALIIQQRYFGASSNIETRFYRAAVTQGNADASVGAD